MKYSELRTKETRNLTLAASSRRDDKILKKIGEEAGETIIGAKNGDRDEIVYETADLWFHSLIALSYFGITPEDIYHELGKRFGKPRESYRNKSK
jgi:phosphoribosyl-ATP pyrophosphohydrolase